MLAEEHIIPYGLNGDFVLPESTCRRCERITGRLESILQRGTLLACRSILGLRTRNPKDRPSRLPLYVGNLKVEVDVKDYPSTLALARFPQPKFFDAEGAVDEGFDLWIRVFKYNTRLLRQKYGLRRYAPPIVPVLTLRRVLAKIAHSFAVAEVGMENFEPFLQGGIINDEESQDLLKYVGGSRVGVSADKGCLHWMELALVDKVDAKYIIANIRLFSYIEESPIYYVIVGRFTSKDVPPGIGRRKCIGTAGVMPPPEPEPDEPIRISIYGRR